MGWGLLGMDGAPWATCVPCPGEAFAPSSPTATPEGLLETLPYPGREVGGIRQSVGCCPDNTWAPGGAGSSPWSLPGYKLRTEALPPRPRPRAQEHSKLKVATGGQQNLSEPARLSAAGTAITILQRNMTDPKSTAQQPRCRFTIPNYSPCKEL